MGKYSRYSFGSCFQTRPLIPLLRLIVIVYLPKGDLWCCRQFQISFRQCLTSPPHQVARMEISGLGEGQQLHLCLVLGRESKWVSVLIPKNDIGTSTDVKAKWYVTVQEVSGCFSAHRLSSKYQLFDKFEIWEQIWQSRCLNVNAHCLYFNLLFFKNDVIGKKFSIRA